MFETSSINSTDSTSKNTFCLSKRLIVPPHNISFQNIGLGTLEKEQVHPNLPRAKIKAG